MFQIVGTPPVGYICCAIHIFTCLIILIILWSGAPVASCDMSQPSHPGHRDIVTFPRIPIQTRFGWAFGWTMDGNRTAFPPLESPAESFLDGISVGHQLFPAGLSKVLFLIPVEKQKYEPPQESLTSKHMCFAASGVP